MNIEGIEFDTGGTTGSCLCFKKTEEVTHNTVVWTPSRTPAGAAIWTPAGAVVYFISSIINLILRTAILAIKRFSGTSVQTMISDHPLECCPSQSRKTSVTQEGNEAICTQQNNGSEPHHDVKKLLARQKI